MTDFDEHPEPTANVRIRPPILFAVSLLMGFALDHLLPIPNRLPPGDGLWHKLIPATVTLLGLAIASAGIRNFVRAGTPVPSNRAVGRLVVTGIHSWSRNPIYVGLLLLHVGIGIAVRSTWIIGLTGFLLVILRYAVIAREEDYLQRRFGERYAAYRSSVRRWM